MSRSTRHVGGIASRAEIEGRCRARRPGRSARLRPGSEASPTTPRPPGRSSPFPTATGGWSVADTLTEAQTLSQEGAGPQLRRRGDLAARDSRRRLGALSADDLRRARLPGAGRVVVRARGRAGVAGRERRRVRREVALDCDRGGEDARSRARQAGPGPFEPRGRGAARPEEAPDRRGAEARRHRDVARSGRTPGSGDLSGWVEAFSSYAPRCSVEVVDVAGPPVSADIRGAGWVEAAVLSRRCELGSAGRDRSRRSEAGSRPVELKSPEGGYASVTVDDDGTVRVAVEAGEVLDEVVLRSYCVGAVHQALGLGRREAVAVDASGQVLDLTIRSFGILPARDMPVSRSK